MAIRGDRNLVAWQAYVIVMSIVAVGLIVGLGISIAGHSNTQRSMEEAVTRAQNSDKSVRELSTESERLKAMLGQRQFTEADWKVMRDSSGGNAQTEALQTQFDKDMSLFGVNEPAQNRSYPKLVETLMRELRDRNLQIDGANRAQAELVKKTNATVKNEVDARKAAEDRADQREKELETARIDFKKQLDDMLAKIDEIKSKQDAAQRQFDAEKAKLTTERDDLSKRLVDRVALNEKLNKRIRELEGEEFQAAQGKVVDVAEGGNVVWINLGAADGLRAGVKFGIVDPSVTKLREARPKAHLEIAEILGPSLARGKVVSGSLQVPVLKNDLVYSVVWQKGRKTQFALMGKMDMNGDGLDDRDILKQMILQGGGTVAEDLAPDGKHSGKMTVDTNWLVVGETYRVTGADDLDSRQREFRSKFAEMQERAKELAVSQINLDKLLVWLQGSGQTERTVPVGMAGSGSSLDDRRRAPASSGVVSELYQKPALPGAYKPRNNP
jgi:hypothetical protein